MDPAFVDKIYRPDVADALTNFLCCDTEMERRILFPSVEHLINSMINDKICESIIYFHVCSVIQILKPKHGINPASRYLDISKVLAIIYKDKDYVNQLSKQTVVMASRTNMDIQNNLAKFMLVSL